MWHIDFLILHTLLHAKRYLRFCNTLYYWWCVSLPYSLYNNTSTLIDKKLYQLLKGRNFVNKLMMAFRDKYDLIFQKRCQIARTASASHGSRSWSQSRSTCQGDSCRWRDEGFKGLARSFPNHRTVSCRPST